MAVNHTFISKGGRKTKKLTPMVAIREKCLECSNWAYAEVKRCIIKDCVLYPFRMGKRAGTE